MSLGQVIEHGGSAIQIIPLTLNAGKITETLGTAIDLNVLGDAEYQLPMTSSESSDERNEVQLIHGVTLSTPKITKAIDKAGNEVTGSGGGGGDAHQMIVNVHESDYTFIMDMLGLKSIPVLVWAPIGQTNADGFVWMIGLIDGTISIKRTGNATNAVPLTFKGKAYELDGAATAGGFITALAAAVSAISQPGLDSSYDLDPTAVISTTSGMLVAGDIANPGLLAGTIVPKQGS